MRACRGNRGQTAVEYLGLILVVGTIIAALVGGGLPKAIAAAVERAICQAAGGAQCAGTTASPGTSGAQVRRRSEFIPRVVPYTSADIKIYDAGGKRSRGDLEREDNQIATGDRDVDAVYRNFVAVDEYFRTRFGRDSYDDKGSKLIATVRWRKSIQEKYQNARWDDEKRRMYFGPGFAGALDVTAHEVTHGVIDSEVDLPYSGEQGALEEALADIFASNIDGNWLLGEDLKIGPVRDMADPERFGQPSHVRDYLVTTQDHGGVHTNSGILNKAYVNLVRDIGRGESEQIVYAALRDGIEEDSGFEDFRAACLAAAKDRYGTSSAEAAGVRAAFAAVGLDGTWKAPRR